MNKSLIWIGAIFGSTAGAYIPALWGVSAFSFTSIIFSGIGGVLGIIAAYKINTRYL